MLPIAQSFDAHADEYDAWYNSEAGRAIFAMEVDCLRPLLHSHKRPYLEVGVGSGRFAQALGIEYGVDPALALLQMAESRGVRVIKARGETLPFESERFGAMLMALTLCFVEDPEKVIREAWRVLQAEGSLVLGLILRGSPWAEYYARQGREGHPLYSRARFFSKGEIESLLQLSRFDVLDYRSTLFQAPGQSHYLPEPPLHSYRESAGFVAIASRKGQI